MRGDRQRRGVGGDDGIGVELRLDLPQHRDLDVEVLDDHLDDQADVAQLRRRCRPARRRPRIASRCRRVERAALRRACRGWRGSARCRARARRRWCRAGRRGGRRLAATSAMPLPMVPAPMTTTALSIGSACGKECVVSAIDGLRGSGRKGGCWHRRHTSRPGAAPARASRGVEAVVEIAERAAERRRGRSRTARLVERLRPRRRAASARRASSARRQSISACSGACAFALVAPQDQRVEQAVAEAHASAAPATCPRPAAGTASRRPGRSRYSQITTESNSVEPSSQHQRRDLRQRVVRHEAARWA